MMCAQCNAWKMAATETADIVKRCYALGGQREGEKLLAMVQRLVRERDEARALQAPSQTSEKP